VAPSPAATNTAGTSDVAASNATRAAAFLASSPAPAASAAPSATVPTTPLAQLPTYPPAPTEVSRPVEIEKVLFVTGAGNMVTAAALVKNPNLQSYVSETVATATAYNASGQALGANTLVTMSLAAGEERWFGVPAFSAPGTVARVDLRFNSPPVLKPASDDPAPKLTVIRSDFDLDRSTATAQQVGQVKNEGKTPATTVNVDVIYFDAAGNLLGVGVGAVKNLTPGQMLGFTVTTPGVNESATSTKVYASAQRART
jgi:hypothetical protein